MRDKIIWVNTVYLEKETYMLDLVCSHKYVCISHANSVSCPTVKKKLKILLS